MCPALVDRLLGVFSRAPAITNFNHLINQSDLNINRKVKTLSNLAFILVLIPSNERSQALESQRAGELLSKMEWISKMLNSMNIKNVGVSIV